uniref:OSIGBa0155K17.10 protein n=1 Tax=Oryza sativa TaxID=4530 RepID=Q00RJ0_ORYSA|nr:OSIGBa0155K17.10 [Oryza sativa]
MGGFDLQVKERAKELKHLKGAVMKGVKVVGDSCKKAWNKRILRCSIISEAG